MAQRLQHGRRWWTNGTGLWRSFLVALALTAVPAWAQDDSSALQLYRLAAQADALALEGQWTAAVAQYQKAFEAHPPFARHWIRGLEAANQARDTAALRAWMPHAARCGLPPSRFLDQTDWSWLHGSSLAAQWAMQAQTWHRQYAQRIDSALLEEMQALFARDQVLRRRANKLLLRWFGGAQKRWDQHSAQAAARIQTLTEAGRFPGERLLGLDHQGRHAKLEAQRAHSGMAMVLLIHYFSSPNDWPTTVYEKACRSGQLPPWHLSTLAHFQRQFGQKAAAPAFGEHPAIGQQAPVPISAAEKAAMDRNRAYWGLLPLQSMERARQQRHPDLIYWPLY